MGLKSVLLWYVCVFVGIATELAVAFVVATESAAELLLCVCVCVCVCVLRQVASVTQLDRQSCQARHTV